MRMKHINITFTDSEHDLLIREKGKRSWHDFILSIIRYDALEVLYHAAMEQCAAGGNDEGLLEQFQEGGLYAEEYAIYQGYKNAHEYAIAEGEAIDEVLETVTKRMKEMELKTNAKD